MFTIGSAREWCLRRRQWPMNLPWMVEQPIENREMSAIEAHYLLANRDEKIISYKGLRYSLLDVEERKSMYIFRRQEGFIRLQMGIKETPIGEGIQYVTREVKYVKTSHIQGLEGDFAFALDDQKSGKVFLQEDGVEYCIAFEKEVMGSRNPALSHALKHYLLAQPYEGKNFLSAQFYQDNESYGQWSLRMHSKVIEEIVQRHPQEKICAPGDGIGVVSKIATPVIAGDLSVGKYTHPSVKKESITQTIMRGINEGATVCILSYVRTFLSPVDHVLLKGFVHVYMIDSSVKHVNDSSYVIGPGVTYTGKTPQVLPFTEKMLDLAGGHVQYTENLLRLPNKVSVRSFGTAIIYLGNMRRDIVFIVENNLVETFRRYGFQSRQREEGDGKLTVILQSLDEWCDYKGTDQRYFLPTGKYMEEEEYDHRLLSPLYARTIYKGKGPICAALARHMGGIVQSEFSFFFFASKEGKTRFEYCDRTDKWSIDIHFIHRIGPDKRAPVFMASERKFLLLYENFRVSSEDPSHLVSFLFSQGVKLDVLKHQLLMHPDRRLRQLLTQSTSILHWGQTHKASKMTESPCKRCRKKKRIHSHNGMCDSCQEIWYYLEHKKEQ